MSEGYIDADSAARFIGVTPKELKSLADSGVLKRVNGQYHAVQLVRDYVESVREEAKQKMFLTQVEIAKRLDMSERNLRDILLGLKIDHKATNYDDIVIAYIRDLREKAAGRGGNGQVNLTRARSDEAVMKTAKMRLEYNREIGILIYTEDAADAINDWCRFGNREWSQGTSRLVHEIENKYKIEVDDKLVESIAGPTTERIKDHAGELGRGLVSRIESVCETEE